jgi:hypothetical protein
VTKTPPNKTDSGYELNHDSVSGKGRPTPSRKEQEHARKRPLVSSDRAEARRIARSQQQALREKARIGLANGEERYLPVRDRGPQKRYARDYVDARFSVGELLIPFMFLVIILTFIPQPEVQAIAIATLWAFFIVAIVDAVLVGFLLRRKLAAKFGADQIEKVRWYAAMRAMQLRVMRLPKPQVKRGKFPV